MTSMERSWQVGRLIQWGLRTTARPVQDAEYQELINLYFDDLSFRSSVREVADGLGLIVVDASEHGIILAPSDNSIFGLKAADFRPGSSKAEDRMLDGLVQIAIATTIFPKARDLDEDPNLARPPVTIEEVENNLRSICKKLEEEAREVPDPQTSDEKRGIIESWRVYQRRLETMETKDERKARRATRRVIEFGLERLREFGCFTSLRTNDGTVWQPTRRYQVLVQQLAATRLYEFLQQVLEQNHSQGGTS
jgi:hypothetical protein